MNAGATSRPGIVVLDDWEGALEAMAEWSPVRDRADLRFCRERLLGAALQHVLAGARVVVLNRERTALDAALLSQLPELRCVIFTGPRNRRIDYSVLQARGIPVCATEGGPALESTAEHTWALILAWARGLEAQFNLMRAGCWRQQPGSPPQELARVLAGERLGLIGCGRIGSRVATVGRAFGMEVVTWSPHMTAERAVACGARHVALDELLCSSRVVSLHLVPAASTQGLIDRERLALMRPDALLVNTARFELIDEAALGEALRSGRPGTVALDVWPEEPLPVDSLWRSEPHLIPTPHTGFVAEAVMRCFANGALEGVLAWLDGRPLPRPVLSESQRADPVFTRPSSP